MDELNKVNQPFDDRNESVTPTFVVTSDEFDHMVNLLEEPPRPLDWIKDFVGKETIDL